MSKIDIYFEGKNFTIQYNKDDKMKLLFQRFLTKSSTSLNSVIFLNNGNNLTNIELTFEKLVNIDERSRNKMTIVVSKADNSSSS